MQLDIVQLLRNLIYKGKMIEWEEENKEEKKLLVVDFSCWELGGGQ